MAVRNLQLAEYSDRELLHIIRDLAGDGPVTSTRVAEQIGVRHENPSLCVSSRLSWLRRYGAVERDEEDGSWRLTADGENYALGRLSARQQAALEGLADEQLVAVTSLVAGRYWRASATGAHLIRREWVYGTNKRRRG